MCFHLVLLKDTCIHTYIYMYAIHTHTHSHFCKWTHTMHLGLSFVFMDWIWGDWTKRILEKRYLPLAPYFLLQGCLRFCCLILFSPPSPRLLPLLPAQAKTISPPHPTLGQGKKPIANDVRMKFLFLQCITGFFGAIIYLTTPLLGTPFVFRFLLTLCKNHSYKYIFIHVCVSIS